MIEMKRFTDWLKSDSLQQSAAIDARRASVGARFRSDKETKGDYGIACTVSWVGKDQADSSIFGTGSLNFERNKATATAPHSTTDQACDLSCDTEDGMGFDPYNSGRFISAKKR